MGFTTTCIIRHKYDGEFLIKLKNIGYNISDLDGDELNCSYMLSMPIYSYIDFGWSEGFFRDIIYNGAIDCGTNEELFLAIAALRDDSDINQWFVLDTTVCVASENCKLKGTFILCKRDKWNVDFDINGNPSVFSSRNIPAHKATVKELIEYFK